MSYIAYTIFADISLTTVRTTYQTSGEKADALVRAFTNLNNGREPHEGDVICGCRIDRIGSEDCTEVAL